MTVEIREYEPSDLEACRGLWSELNQKHRDIYDDQQIGGEDPGKQFDRYVERADLVGPWVAVADGQVVGLSGLLHEGKDGEVEPVIVSETFRSQGIGGRLIEHVKEAAARRGVRMLSIRPVARNAEAVACFHKAGFSLLGHLELFVELEPLPDRQWKKGIEIHQKEFGF